MEENPKFLDLKKSILTLALLVLLVLVFIFFFSFLSSRRQAMIHHQYEAETNLYISKNTQGLKEIFTKVLPKEADSCSVEPPSFNSCASMVNDRRAKIDHLISSDLKDFSSTMFARINNHQEILVMRLSGDVRTINIFQPEKEVLLRKLLEGQVSSIPWDYYSSELSTKEIYIPVKDENGNILGALARGVIQ